MKIKKLGAVVLALAMMMLCCVSAFATGYSINVTNATADTEYTLYKVFDASYSSDGLITYTYDGSDDTFVAALQGEDSPFNCAENAAGTYNISLKDAKTSSDVASFLADYTSSFELVTTETATDDGTLTLDAQTPGYFYLTSGLGTVVTLTSAAPTATVIDKNQKPGPGKDEPSDIGDPDAEAHYKQLVDENGDYVAQNTSKDEGSVVYFKLSCSATNYDGTTKITEYVAHDVLGAGYKDFEVTSAVVTDANGTHEVTLSDDDVVVSEEETTITIAWVDADNNSLYASNANIDIYCQAKMNGTGENYTNTGYFTWTGHESATPGTPVEPSDAAEVTVETYDITIEAHDATDTEKKLEGTYVLQDEDGKYYKYDDENKEVSWVDDIEDATHVTTEPETGVGVIHGIEEGEYTLVETDTPDGYSPLTSSPTVSVGSDTPVDIPYNSGSELPTTGGLGTTLFITFGMFCIMAAGIFLVTNKRMTKETF